MMGRQKAIAFVKSFGNVDRKLLKKYTEKLSNPIRSYSVSMCVIRKSEKNSGEEKRYLSAFNDYVVRSSYPEFEVPDLPLHEFIFQNLSSWETKTAVECGLTGRKWTYRDLFRKSKSLAFSLQKIFKLEKGDRVAVVLSNCPEYPAIFLAASMTGIVPTTINPSYTPVEISLQLKDTDSKVIVTFNEVYGKCLEALKLLKKTIPIVVAKIQMDAEIPTGSVPFEDLCDQYLWQDFKTTSVDVKNDALVLPYSSGTSGLPKGVELTHRNVVANLLQYRMMNEMKSNPEKDTGQCSILGILPMFHIYGMVTVTLDAIGEGGRLITLPKFEPKLFVDTIVNKKAQLLYLVPPLVFFLNNHLSESKNLDCVQHVVVGAAPCGATDMEKLMKKGKNLKIVQGYGMTETSPVVTASHISRYHKISSTGHPLPLTSVKVVEVDTERALPVGEKGEIRVKGPQVMKGYLNRSEETKNCFDEDGWLKTGDIGYYDEEFDFFVVDRMKELIKVKGFQVAPAELEEFIRSHPKVADVGVIGINHHQYGEVPKAFVVVKTGVSCTEDEIKKYVQSNLSVHKQLVGGVEFLEEIPKSNSGKILRKNLKKFNDRNLKFHSSGP